MRRLQRSRLAIFTALLIVGFALASHVVRAQAETVNGPSLTISQLKITSSNGQFITLYNSTAASVDMSKYQLEYFNHYDLSKASSSKLIALSGTVPPHGYFMINDSTLLLCYQLTVDSISLGLSSTSGFIELLAFSQSSPGSSVMPVLQDYVGWSKTAAAGAQTLPASTNAFLRRQPLDNSNNPLITSPGSGAWQSVQPDSSNPCLLTTTAATPTPLPTVLSQLPHGTEPPASIVVAALDDVAAPTPHLPAADVGLAAPQITELLANPNGTGNDASDEFIELYNSNAAAFDLSGFTLQVGLTTLHNYVFPAGSSIPGHAFKAFYAADTGLSLSNSGGQAALLDPLGNNLSLSEPYTTAKDGQVWALANGKWYWSETATPGAANVIKLPPTKKKTSVVAAKKPSQGKAATAKVAPKGSSTAATSQTFPEPSTVPIHTWTLALVAGLALLYGAYEYRTDLANRFYRFKSHFSVRRADRP